jgi:hypothetical protein
MSKRTSHQALACCRRDAPTRGTRLRYPAACLVHTRGPADRGIVL